VEERRLEHAIRDETREPREHEARSPISFQSICQVTAEVVRHVRPRLGGDEPAAERQRARGGGVHMARVSGGEGRGSASLLLEPP